MRISMRSTTPISPMMRCAVLWSSTTRRRSPKPGAASRRRSSAGCGGRSATASERRSSAMPDPALSEDEINRLHREKMERRQAARRKVLATKTEERGLLIVHTGAGKGKSTAAFGMVLRCLGHGMRVGIVQFVKGAWGTGERDVLARFPDLVTCRAMGEGFTWDTQDRARDIAAARAAWEVAKEMI